MLGKLTGPLTRWKNTSAAGAQELGTSERQMWPRAQGLLDIREDLNLDSEKQTQLLQCKITAFQPKMVPVAEMKRNCQRNSRLAPSSLLSFSVTGTSRWGYSLSSQGFLKTSSWWCHALVGVPGCQVGSGVNHIYTPLLLSFQGSFLLYKIALFVMML